MGKEKEIVEDWNKINIYFEWYSQWLICLNSCKVD